MLVFSNEILDILSRINAMCQRFCLSLSLLLYWDFCWNSWWFSVLQSSTSPLLITVFWILCGGFFWVHERFFGIVVAPPTAPTAKFLFRNTLRAKECKSAPRVWLHPPLLSTAQNARFKSEYSNANCRIFPNGIFKNNKVIVSHRLISQITFQRKVKYTRTHEFIRGEFA